MLSHAQEKLIKSLQKRKAREESGQCLVEGSKVIETAGSAMILTFTRNDTELFDELVTTETPQDVAGIATIPKWTSDDLARKQTIVVLDGVQDPGNVGAILRLCLGFDAGLILIESADPTSPKVVRASTGAMFSVPWTVCSRDNAHEAILGFSREIIRLEKQKNALDLPAIMHHRPLILIAGSEGSGIQLPLKAPSLTIQHDERLESLNVSQALAIALHARFQA
ncbi:MAG: RNA methyltransferase [Patescibacteria group bacterium]|jgi:TrmH family RNA methyltransferase